MIRAHFAILQLPLLYFFSVTACLGVLGSEFRGIVGVLYLLPLFLLPLLGPLPDPIAGRRGRTISVTLLVSGALGSAAFSRELLSSPWDEQSLLQAALVASLSVPVFLAARIGWQALGAGPGFRRNGLSASLALIALLHAMAWVDVALLFLGISLCLASTISLVGAPSLGISRRLASSSPESPREVTSSSLPPSISLGLIFWLFGQGTVPIWDYGLITTWGGLTALLLLGAALGVLAHRPGRRGLLALGLVPGGVALGAGILSPEFSLGPIHALLSGLSLGVAIAGLAGTPGDGATGPPRAGWPIAATPVMALAMIAGYQHAAQEPGEPALRLLLLAPLLIAVGLRVLSRSGVLRQGNRASGRAP